MLNSSKFQNMMESDSINDIKTKVNQFFK